MGVSEGGRSLCLTVSQFSSFIHSLFDIYFLSEEQITMHLGEAAQVVLFAIVSVYLSLPNPVIIIFVKTNDIFFGQINYGEGHKLVW